MSMEPQRWFVNKPNPWLNIGFE
uniref:Uncharacterized protein n=1 Tax=Anguilla anguilla TaxID=7936 RepID=A0A0E9R1T9_ANGAN